MTAGHAHHFLSRLDRVSRAETEFALSLYRKPEIVRAIVALKRPDPEVERLALGLSHAPDSPHVIVSRTGGFVTCLAQGMTPYDALVVPRAELDVIGRGIATLEAEIRRYDQDTDTASEDASLRALADAGNRLCREDYLAIERIRVVLWPALVETAHVSASQLGESAQALRTVVHPTAAQRDTLALHWRLLWGSAHATLLGLSEGVSFQLAQGPQLAPLLRKARAACALTLGRGVLGVALRAVRAAAYLVSDHFDDFAKMATEAPTWPQYSLAPGAFSAAQPATPAYAPPFDRCLRRDGPTRPKPIRASSTQAAPSSTSSATTPSSFSVNTPWASDRPASYASTIPPGPTAPTTTSSPP